MKPKKQIFLSVMKVIAIPVGIFLVLTALLAIVLQPPVANWIFGPHDVRFSNNILADTNERFHVRIPEALEYIKGVEIPSRDPTVIYFFELDTAAKLENETAYDYILRTLSADPEEYRDHEITSAAGILFADDLSELGYSFTNMITLSDGDFKEIHYKQTEPNTLLIAFVYGYS